MNAAAIEVFYLARVGAFRYLDAVYAALCARLGTENVPPVPTDRGLVPRPAGHPYGTPPRLRNLSAFGTYAAAERAALAALDGLPDVELKPVCDRLADGIGEGEAVRTSLLRRGEQVPGRGVWLVSEESV